MYLLLVKGQRGGNHQTVYPHSSDTTINHRMRLPNTCFCLLSWLLCRLFMRNYIFILMHLGPFYFTKPYFNFLRMYSILLIFPSISHDT